MVNQDLAAPAPLALADVEASLRPFGSSRMLPRAAYVDPAVLAWEHRRFFADGWSCVGFSCDVARPGDQRAEWVGAGGILLLRADDGVLRAFANTCRHRGHELLPCGSATNYPVVICPYHSWTYGLDGSLRAAAGFKGRGDFEAAAHGLVELPAVEWHGLVFVDSSAGRAEPLAAGLDTLEELVAPYQPGRLQIADRHDYAVGANWKILTENYHECYHCPAIHPELCKLSPPRSGENYARPGTWIGGWMQLRDGVETMSVDGRCHGAALPGLSAEERRQVVYVNLFPNVLLSLHPDYVMTHRLTPLAADRTRIECTWAFDPDVIAGDGFDPAYAVDFWDLTNRQDWSACESVQRGLSSEHAIPGPLSAEEDAVYQFVTMVARAYTGQRVWNPGADVPVG